MCCGSSKEKTHRMCAWIKCNERARARAAVFFLRWYRMISGAKSTPYVENYDAEFQQVRRINYILDIVTICFISSVSVAVVVVVVLFSRVAVFVQMWNCLHIKHEFGVTSVGERWVAAAQLDGDGNLNSIIFFSSNKLSAGQIKRSNQFSFGSLELESGRTIENGISVWCFSVSMMGTKNEFRFFVFQTSKFLFTYGVRVEYTTTFLRFVNRRARCLPFKQ